ncbi:hypothetical protein [Actinomadura sp. 9N215]|uniref:hypothetical protein n=1 Tax=Actinomadura sp. 9N215 TaxID=3375150 RepID=UPI003799D164
MAATPAATAQDPEQATLLMTFYEHANYNRDQPGRSVGVYGDAGTCDSEGYVFTVANVPPLNWWPDHLSSITGVGSCTAVLLSSHGGAEIRWNLPASFGSTGWNDNVRKLRVYRR